MRRLFAASFALVLLGVAALLLLRPGSASPPARTGPWYEAITEDTRASRPNLLFVVYDARRRDDFSFGPMGNRSNDTPFLSEFTQEAVYFPEAVSPGCWTVPVHAAMFSGLKVCELGSDYYSPGHALFPTDFLSLAEILHLGGYRTIAYADHPYFFLEDTRRSLIRGFELFNVINDFKVYASRTNVGTSSGKTESAQRLTGLDDIDRAEVESAIRDFNAGRLQLDPEREADHEPDLDLYLPPLYDLFRQSAYFRKRYGDEFDRYVFRDGDKDPFFLFLNLHMCTVADPDPGLHNRWLLRLILLNASARAKPLPVMRPAETPAAWIKRSYGELGLPAPGFILKQIYDNRFYDASFRAVWEYLEGRGLTRNTLTVVTSDHGMSFGEQGESLFLHGGARPTEYLTRVPLILRAPAGSELSRLHGRRSEPVSLIDLFPTLVEAGVGRDVFRRSLPVRGESLFRRIAEDRFDSVLVAESAAFPQSYSLYPSVAGYTKAVYEGNLKLIHAPVLRRMGWDAWPLARRLQDAWPDGTPTPVVERLSEPLDLLYDLALDPLEQNNLAPERPETLRRLRARADNWDCQPLVAASGARPTWDADAIETLRALGYVH